MKQPGDVSEWLKEHAWKACKGQPFESSNLSVTAIFSTDKVRGKPEPLNNKGVSGFFMSKGFERERLHPVKKVIPVSYTQSWYYFYGYKTPCTNTSSTG
jgi:hypothetical protein